jgi:CubicO group peptidase (beta-lactamase class C family)
MIILLLSACSGRGTIVSTNVEIAETPTAGEIPLNENAAPTLTPVPTATTIQVPDDRCNFTSRGFDDAVRTFKDKNDDTSEWTFSTPEEHGLNPDVLYAGLSTLEETGLVTSLLIIRDGVIVVEDYFNGADEQTSANVFSTSKSILSALVGIALREGYIESLDQTLGELLPSLFGSIDDPAKSEVTLRHLLTMTSGLEWVDDFPYFEAFESENWIESVWSYPMIEEPGNIYNYNTGLTHTMSAILTEATGMSTCEFAYQYLFDPLGITVEHWSTDPQDYYFGGTHLFLTPRELAKFGLLYIAEGQWEGEQIVPEEWIRDSTHYSGLGDADYYGYWWWLGDISGYQAIRALGHGGQTIFIFPELDMIVVTSSRLGEPEYPTMYTIHDFVEGFVIPSITIE